MKSTTGGGDVEVRMVFFFFFCRSRGSCTPAMCRWGAQARAVYRSEFDVSGHQLGYTYGEGCELLMDVHEEGV